MFKLSEWSRNENNTMGDNVTKKEVIAYLQERIDEAGGQNALARKIKVDVATINRGVKQGILTDALLEGLGVGYRTATTYFFKKKRGG